MKLISWNVNGLRACINKGFNGFFSQLDADIFCLQETKLQPDQISLALPGYRQYWNSAEKKGYSGTAVFSRLEPLSVRYGLGIDEHDHAAGAAPGGPEVEQHRLVAVQNLALKVGFGDSDD